MDLSIECTREHGDQAVSDDTTIRLDQTEDELLAYDTSDEALESAAGTGGEKAGNYTLYFCTALDLCPGP